MKRIKQTHPLIMGIDPSPTGTGIVFLRGKQLCGFYFFAEAKGVIKKYPENAIPIIKVKWQDESGRILRLYQQRTFIERIARLTTPDYIAYEDYIWNSSGKSSGVYQIAELGGVLRLNLWEEGFKVRTYHPASVKLSWVGKGNAEKEDMIKRFRKWMEVNNPDKVFTFEKMADKYLENIADATATATLLQKELIFRKGKIRLDQMSESMIKVLNRVTNSMPDCLIDRPFLERDDDE